MAVKIDGKKIVERLKKRADDRKKVSLYLSEKVMGDFKKACENEDVSASMVMEELMKEFIISVKK